MESKQGLKRPKAFNLSDLGLSRLLHGKHAGASIQRQEQRSRPARRSNSCREQHSRKSCNRLIQKWIQEGLADKGVARPTDRSLTHTGPPESVDQVKIRQKSDSDYRLRGVTWSDIENQGLVFSRCALEVKGRAAANVIGLGDLFRGFVRSLRKMVGDIARSPKKGSGAEVPSILPLD